MTPGASIWNHAVALALALLVIPARGAAQKFYADDPLLAVPPPKNVQTVVSRKLSDYYDFLRNTFSNPGERHTNSRIIPAQEVNTLGEAPNSTWYTNRHYFHPMSLEELVRGAGNANTPSFDGPWTVMKVKTEGITPGFDIEDSRGRRYVVKFDPVSNPEIATAADVITSKFLHALGYFVPENYIVEFDRERLVLGEGVQLTDSLGTEHPMTERDLTEILLDAPRAADGKYRAVASLYLSGRNVGPFRFYSTRRDDPNDVVPHEHRRDLRGYSVFCAWLGHDDSRSTNTSDFLIQESGIQYIRHYLIDFGSTLGSASNGPNSPRSGFEYLFAWKRSIVQLLTFGVLVPEWARADFPDLPSVGRFEWEKFDAEGWVPEYPNAAFSNRLPDDAFWAAKQVMAFSDDAIRAIVSTGRYSDARAEAWVVECLIRRRDKIGKAFLTKVLPLDRFAIRDGRLAFEDLGVMHRLVASREYVVQWSRFDNNSQRKTALAGEDSFSLPRVVDDSDAGWYFSADIHGGDPGKMVTVYVRRGNDGMEIVGIDRKS